MNILTRASGIGTRAIAGLSAMVGAGVAALALTATPAVAAPAGCAGDLSGKGWINVEVNGVKNSDGLIAITVYADDSNRFLRSKGSLDVVRFPAKAGTFRGCVKLPGNGVYALVVYHDEDGSRKLNRSGFGLPTEGFGFSNNPSTLAGLPTFRSVRLNVPKPGLTTRIDMRYP